MFVERHSQRLLQDVSRQHNTGAGFRKSAGDHGAAFPGGCLTAAPVDGAELFEFRWPGLREFGEQ